MSRQHQINELLQNELGKAISKHAALTNGIITVTYVDCSPDLKNANVGVSVLPENIKGTALRLLRKNTNPIINEINKNTRLRKFPKLKWKIDVQGEKISEIDRLLSIKY